MRYKAVVEFLILFFDFLCSQSSLLNNIYLQCLYNNSVGKIMMNENIDIKIIQYYVIFKSNKVVFLKEKKKHILFSYFHE